jgi:excisionase family DNA binding protein
MNDFHIPMEMKKPGDTVLLTVPDVAKLLSISPSMVYTLVQRRAIPAVRIGTAVRLRPCDVESYIQSSLTQVR